MAGDPTTYNTIINTLLLDIVCQESVKERPFALTV